MDTFQHRFNETAMDQGQTPPDLSSLAFQVNRILYYVSISLCFIATIIYVVIRYADGKYDRISLRLLVQAIYAHIFMGIAGILRTIPTSDRVCQFIMVVYVFTDLYSTFCLLCIAMNCQIVFLHEKRDWKYRESCYIVGCFVSSLVLSLIPLFVKNGGYGRSTYMDCCWFIGTSDLTMSMWSMLTIYLWVCISIIYSVIALVFVLIKTGAEEQKINQQLVYSSRASSKRRFHFTWLCFRPNESMPQSGKFSPRRTSYFLKTVSRVIWYPTVLVTSRVWGVINFGYISHTGKIKAFYVLMANVAVPFQGFLLFFIFLCDPAFQIAIRDLYTHYWSRQWRWDREPAVESGGLKSKKPARSFFTMSDIADRISMPSVANAVGGEETLTPYMTQHLRADLSYQSYPNPVASDPQLYAQQLKQGSLHQRAKSTASLDTMETSAPSRNDVHPSDSDNVLVVEDDVSQL